ncbi:uncharacterized protein [Choristoneura fumiferana]|uniref:uncharacterized protein n=1 Tax=Choristoneura fumiferana TaxID=7141 RepID=UPI003D15BDEB
MAYLQVALISLALCFGINAFTAVPSQDWPISISHQFPENLRNDQFHAMIQQQLASIGPFQVSMSTSTLLRSLIYALSPAKPIGRQFVAKKDEFSAKNAKKYNDDPCDDESCVHACQFFFDKGFGFCAEVLWCVCYD